MKPQSIKISVHDECKYAPNIKSANNFEKNILDESKSNRRKTGPLGVLELKMPLLVSFDNIVLALRSLCPVIFADILLLLLYEDKLLINKLL